MLGEPIGITGETKDEGVVAIAGKEKGVVLGSTGRIMEKEEKEDED